MTTTPSPLVGAARGASSGEPDSPVSHRVLRAVTRPLDPPANLLDARGADGFAWLHDGAGFVTAGRAATVAPVDARSLLAAIEHDDGVECPGAGPLAVGAFPFDPKRSTTLHVPQRIVGRDADGRGWVTELGPAVGALPEPGGGPAQFTMREHTTRTQWDAAVRAALAAIDRGELEKVVLARRLDIVADRAFDRRAVLDRLVAEQPGCFVYAWATLLGASPELLVSRRGARVESRPMAGTSLATDAGIERLRRSAKDAREHRPVVDAIVDALAPLCTDLTVEPRPEIARFASVAHLVTPVVGTLRDPAPDVVAIARKLHPTPAVAGTPRGPALAAIARLEGDDRGGYAGPVGWMDARGDGEWVVALRGASIDGAIATLHAGAGIVAGSVPADEWRETEAKLEPMVRALTRREEEASG